MRKLIAISTKLVLSLTACTKTTVPVVLPVITLNAVTDITRNTAISGGNITADNGGPITERGVCWSKTPSPTISNSKTLNGSGLGVFTSEVTGLTSGTTYYLRAYATNNAGTVYSSELVFITF
jgi:hypothetical protein